jgi:8-oxo-dGTP pyrophosphatase MutT (NUDIX family)
MITDKNAGTAVFYKDNVLLAKRIETYRGKPVTLGGYWSIFAGRVEEGEAPYNAAHRELYEETKIKPSGLSPIRYFQSFHGDDYEFLFYILEVDSFISPQLCDEHTEYGWFKIDGLKSFPYDLDDAILKCILDYDKTRNKQY